MGLWKREVESVYNEDYLEELRRLPKGLAYRQSWTAVPLTGEEYLDIPKEERFGDDVRVRGEEGLMDDRVLLRLSNDVFYTTGMEYFERLHRTESAWNAGGRSRERLLRRVEG